MKGPAMSPSSAPARPRVFVYGWSVIAPGASNLEEFKTLVENPRTALTPLRELHEQFLVGTPSLEFERHESWITERFGPKRFSQLDNAGENVKLAVASTLDALRARPGLEEALHKLDPELRIDFASGASDLRASFAAHDEFNDARKLWYRFWAAPARNPACARFLDSGLVPADSPPPPPSPLALEPDSVARARAWEAWDSYWAPHSEALGEFARELALIESQPLGPDIASSKLHQIRSRAKAVKELQSRFGCPTPPWEAVSPNLVWNIENAPAAQVSMLLNLHGPSTGSAAACASFGYVLASAVDNIRMGRCKAAIIGAIDSSPTPELVSAFYGGRLAVYGMVPGIPLCDLRGTHIAGGATTWIIAAEDAMAPLGLEPLQVEILGTGLSSDAEHIITPSKEGPKLAIRRSLADAGLEPEAVDAWDLHATGTPGDWSELRLVEDIVPERALISARKGIFGHGMGVCGGWELTAQALSVAKVGPQVYELAACGIAPNRVHPDIKQFKRHFLLDTPLRMEVPAGQEGIVCGKLSMGVGGISSCVHMRVSPR